MAVDYPSNVRIGSILDGSTQARSDNVTHMRMWWHFVTHNFADQRHRKAAQLLRKQKV